MSTVGIYLASDDAKPPVKLTNGACAFDVSSCEDVFIDAKKTKPVDTGLIVSTSNNLICWMLPRSGLAFKHGITILNTPGTIDRDYRGTIKVLLYNTSDEGFSVKKGDRICQMIFVEEANVNFWFANSVDDFTKTQRNTGGFGSTGKLNNNNCAPIFVRNVNGRNY